MKVIPISLKQANNYIFCFHRHNKPVQGHKWSIGVVDEYGVLIGVGTVGRPIARLLDDGFTLEILRVCTNGTPNLNSFIYGKIARIARMMGYQKIITYTLEKESGASLRAVGAIPTVLNKSNGWDRKNRPRNNQEVYFEKKIRWSL